MRHIPVTLVCIDCVDVKRALRAIDESLKQCSFERIVFLSSIENDSPYWIQCEKIESLKEYSAFCVHRLHKYIDTSHCLIIQHDGWIVNGDAWQDSWLEYDYIGGNTFWTGAGPDGKGGNGGFSLRSKRLLEAGGSSVNAIFGCHPEDIYLSSSIHGRKVSKLEKFEGMGFKYATRLVQKDFCNERTPHTKEFGHHKCDLGTMDKDGWRKTNHIYAYDRTHLGDQWATINRMLLASNNTHYVCRASCLIDGVDYSKRMLEIIDLLDHKGQIELVKEPATRTLGQPCILTAEPYLPTKQRWAGGKGMGVCYQFDGLKAAEGNKNPPPDELIELETWCSEHDGVRLGNHLTLAQCVDIMANSSLFVGVCSGMSHIAHSVGIPTFIIEYEKPIKAFHMGKEYTHCRGTKDTIEKLDAFMRDQPI